MANLQKESPKATVGFCKTDVSNQANVNASFADTFKTYGYIDVLVNSAGIFDERTPDRVMAINTVSEN